MRKESFVSCLLSHPHFGNILPLPHIVTGIIFIALSLSSHSLSSLSPPRGCLLIILGIPSQLGVG